VVPTKEKVNFPFADEVDEENPAHAIWISSVDFIN
jgi:hypothetical protein